MPARAVSVVIPTFNRALELPAALDSVMGQSTPPGEIIVVDDGSTDDTAAVLGPMSRAGRIRYHRTANQGVSAARNTGIGLATGELVAFLDSDDHWHPAKLARQLECMARLGASACFTASQDETGAALDDVAALDPELPVGGTALFPAGDARLFLHQRHPFVQSLLVERRVLAELGGFDQGLAVAEDTQLVYRLALVHGFAVVNEPLVTVTRDRATEGLSDSMDPERAYQRFECYARVQSEAYPQVAARDPQAGAVVRANWEYFLSRQAEIACALGERSLARDLARGGALVQRNWRNVVRNQLIWHLYPVAHRRFVAKWGR